MRRLALRAASMTSLLLLSGCGWLLDVKLEQNRAGLRQIEIGMPREQVVAILGQPRSREVRGQTEYLMYRTETTEPTTPTTSKPREDYLVPVAINDGRVADIGWKHYQTN